jgi:hypothetical protein
MEKIIPLKDKTDAKLPAINKPNVPKKLISLRQP